MGHPMHVVFLNSRHAEVSPVVHCHWGGDACLRDLQRVIQETRTFGASEMALDLAIRWSLEYGKHSVAIFNLNPSGLADGMSEAQLYQAALAFVRAKVEADQEWTLVEIPEFRAIHKSGVWTLTE